MYTVSYDTSHTELEIIRLDFLKGGKFGKTWGKPLKSQEARDSINSTRM